MPNILFLAFFPKKFFRHFLNYSYLRLMKFIKFANDYSFLPIVLVAVYMLFCFFGSKVMKNCKEFDLRLTLAAWNALLSGFSFIGMFRTVPFLLASILSKRYYDTICTLPTDNGGTFPWIWLLCHNNPKSKKKMFILISSNYPLHFSLYIVRLWLRTCRILGHVIYLQ